MDSSTQPTAPTKPQEGSEEIFIHGIKWTKTGDDRYVLQLGADYDSAERLSRLAIKTGSKDMWQLLRRAFSLYEWFKEQIATNQTMVVEDLDGKIIFKIPAKAFDLID
jgi:hypothetical protein